MLHHVSQPQCLLVCLRYAQALWALLGAVQAAPARRQLKRLGTSHMQCNRCRQQHLPCAGAGVAQPGDTVKPWRTK